MDNRVFQILGDNYYALAADPRAAADCLSNYLCGSKARTAAMVEHIDSMYAWADKAPVGKYFITEDFTVRVLDKAELGCSRLIVAKRARV